MKEWDLNEYTISQESKEEIDVLFEKFIIEIPYKSPLVSKNRNFFDFMVDFSFFFLSLKLFKKGG